MKKKKVLIVEDEYAEANNLQLIVEKAGYQVTGIARSVPQALELLENQHPDLALLDISLKGKQSGIDLGRLLGPLNIPFIFLSANNSADTLEAAKRTQPYGYLFKPYRTNDVLIAMEIAEYRHEHNVEGLIRQQALIEDQLNAIAVTGNDLHERLLLTGKILQSYLPFDYLGYEWSSRSGNDAGGCGFYRVGFDEYEKMEMNGLQDFYGEWSGPCVVQATKPKREPVFGAVSAEELGRRFSKAQTNIFLELRMESLLMVPLDPGSECHFNMLLASRQPAFYKGIHHKLADQLQKSLTESIRRMMGMYRPGYVKTSERPSVQIDETEKAFEGIVGNSHLLLHVFDVIKQVAPIDSTVLILGESGTGKEKIAETIHRLSGRKEGPFIRINCAGFAPSLIESELFGYEKGAFTGAMERRIGKFEQAHRGTIFLDEVGEMPLESQVKFLRVLQERQIERIGARAVTPIDIRIIAATNRNLEREVADGQFRLDLYYRLNVFPIELPPLRDRTEDIAVLARHFITRFRERTGKIIRDIHADVLIQLEAYQWPGNIRELEHVMERSLVLCKGEILEQVMLPAGAMAAISSKAGNEKNYRIKSLKEYEKEYLTAVIKSCDGRLSGKNGAATILGIPSSTLYSKLIKLGIRSRGLIVLIAILFFSCHDKSPLISTSFADSLATEYSTAPQLCSNDRELQFWNNRIDTANPGEINESRYAGALVTRFRYTGMIADLITAENIYYQIDSTFRHRLSAPMLQLASTDMLRHRFSGADSMLERAKKLGIEKYVEHNMSFDVLFELGRWDEAAFHLQSLKYYRDYNYYFRRAKYEHLLGHTDSALAAIRRAEELTTQPGLKALALSNEGDLLMHTGRFREAAKNFTNALKLNPADLHTLLGIGWIALINDRDSSLAGEIFRIASERNELPDPYFKLYQLGQWRHDTVQELYFAREFARLASKPEYGGMYNKYLIELYTGILHAPEKAEHIARKELENRATPQTYAWYAYALLSNHKQDEAYQVFENNISGKPLEAPELYYCGKVLKAADKGFDANACFDAALINSPDLSPAMLEDIQQLNH